MDMEHPSQNLISLQDSNQSLGNELKYTCDLCPKTYSILMRFNRHKIDHQNGKIKLKQQSQRQMTHFQCEVCKKDMQN